LKPGLTLRGAALLACVLLGSLSACGTKSGGTINTAGLQGSTTELRTASDETTDEKRASIRLQLAVGYYQEGNFAVALDEVKKALAIKSDYPEAFSMRALIYTSMGEMALAEENYQSALRLQPRNPDLSNNYGSFLCQSGRGPQGMAYFEAALKDPMYQSPIKAMVNAGSCALKMKQYDVAERYLKSAQGFAPDSPVINAGLAQVYYARRDISRAGDFINRMLEQSKPETLSADVLWLAIRVQRKLGEEAVATSLATQLRRRHPASPEFAAFQRGAFDE
jgi:type IV pilus assembly protein PilF